MRLASPAHSTRSGHATQTPTWATLAAITAVAAALRLIDIGAVASDPFYDAAVRSMGLSWHNFFFGAFEPGGSVSIDKPPLDLWLQVASVKLFGFSSTALKLPEALAGTVSVPLLFAAVRRIWSTPAALAAAAALAVLPVEVITSRSDTMDGVMMALTTLALLALVRAGESGRVAWLLAGAAALGLAFNVKLLESVVALPGLAVFAYLALPGGVRRRLLGLTAAATVYVVVSLSWLSATLLFAPHDRPYAIGSTDGSAWNAAFVFNGSDRLAGKSPEPAGALYRPGHRYPVATQAERNRIPIVPPSATRLLARVGPLSGERLGLELLIGLLLGIPALAWGLRARPPTRLRRAAAGGLTLWALAGLVLFSHMARLHPRYVEGFTPAVAALLGIGVAWAAAARDRARQAALALALAVTVYYVERLLYGPTGVWWITLGAALAALALMVWARAGPPARLWSGALLVLTLAAVLAVPLSADVAAIKERTSLAGYVGALPAAEQRPLSAYLLTHQGDARYEVAAESATAIGSLVVADVRPIVVLTTYDARVFTTVARLRRLAAEGEVKYAFLNTPCTTHLPPGDAGCSAPVRWVRAHGTDVSRRAGLPRAGTLWLLPR